ncbi:MAG: acetyl-CoA carboxylase biotin carboxylase subunit [Acidobacteriota bacterium]
MGVGFDKVLVANRGEIAVRVIRACRDLGIRSIAVYSEPDRASLHVVSADEAHLIGPAAASESYLSIEKVIDAARRSGAQAIHPGYGFLSENADFAEACERARIVFIGPPAAAIRAMGDKVAARRRMKDAGVDPVPGSDGPVRSLDELQSESARIGFPILVKASAGGGGKGMRLVRDPAELASAYEQARSEALRAFGNDAVYLERYLERPRHVEIQVLADAHGHTLHLGERDCSLQRRHQKVIEECPSPAVGEALRERMAELAVKAAAAVGYVGAGTVELLLDASGRFYFLEMNTRLQVEHPVTELVTGLDLVTLQIRIAAGEALPFEQKDVKLSGAAIECRLYAEDPETFLPSPGRIAKLALPSGPSVRVDSGIYEGWEVSIHYDPLLAKICAHGPDRPTALARMRRALREVRVLGIQTNQPLHEALLADPDVAAGRYHTHLLEERKTPARGNGHAKVAALVAALHHHRHQGGAAPEKDGTSPWKRSALPRGASQYLLP